jgi:hypothetical protein
MEPESIMLGTEDYHVRQNKPEEERKLSHVLSQVLNLDLKKMNDRSIKQGTIWE